MSSKFQPLSIIYHQNYDIPVPKIHSFVGSKFSDLFEYLQKKYASSLNVITPSFPSLENLEQIHHIDYINKVEKSNLTKDYLRLINLPWSNRLRERSFLEIEGTLLTAKQALKNGIACHVGGGTHHAHFSYGYGFCIFNDLAYTAINLIEEKLVKNVLVLDLDVHQGDGTIDICQNYPSIYTCSVHSKESFPFDKKKGWLDIGLPSQIGDFEYLKTIEKTLQNIKDKITPDIVIYDAGVDVHVNDKLGNFKLSTEGIHKRDRIVLDHFLNHKIPIATVIGGGYSKNISELAERHSIIFENAIKQSNFIY